MSKIKRHFVKGAALTVTIVSIVSVLGAGFKWS
jgi:hypothetical protein